MSLNSLKEFLPKEYIKQKGAEKKVFQVCSASAQSLYHIMLCDDLMKKRIK